MKKKSQLQHSRSGYFISPVGKALKTPEHHTAQLPSPFPPHVHKYLFSGREITLCDQSGIRISKVAESCESTKRHIDTILAKLEHKPMPVFTEQKRKSIPSLVEDFDHPYHLNEKICAVLKEFADKHSQHKVLDNSESDEVSLEFEAPPQPSPLLKQFLRDEGRKHEPKKKALKARVALSIQHFSQPRRGSQPGIVGNISPSASTFRLPSGVSSPMVRSSAQSPAPKDVTAWNTTRRLLAVHSSNVSPEPPISMAESSRRERYKRKYGTSGKRRLASLFEIRP